MLCFDQKQKKEINAIDSSLCLLQLCNAWMKTHRVWTTQPVRPLTMEPSTAGKTGAGATFVVPLSLDRQTELWFVNRAVKTPHEGTVAWENEYRNRVFISNPVCSQDHEVSLQHRRASERLLCLTKHTRTGNNTNTHTSKLLLRRCVDFTTYFIGALMNSAFAKISDLRSCVARGCQDNCETFLWPEKVKHVPWLPRKVCCRMANWRKIQTGWTFFCCDNVKLSAFASYVVAISPLRKKCCSVIESSGLFSFCQLIPVCN